MTEFKPKERQIRDEYDVKAEMLKVQTKVAKAMTSDFVKCHVPEEKRMAIVDMVSNAYYSKKLQMMMANKVYKWKWEKETTTWKKVKDTEKAEEIEKHAEITFNTFMVKLEAYALLQRNDERNWLLKVINHVREEDEIQGEEAGMIGQIKGLLKPKKEVQQ